MANGRLIETYGEKTVISNDMRQSIVFGPDKVSRLVLRDIGRLVLIAEADLLANRLQVRVFESPPAVGPQSRWIMSAGDTYGSCANSEPVGQLAGLSQIVTSITTRSDLKPPE